MHNELARRNRYSEIPGQQTDRFVEDATDRATMHEPGHALRTFSEANTSPNPTFCSAVLVLRLQAWEPVAGNEGANSREIQKDISGIDPISGDCRCVDHKLWIACNDT